MNAARTSVAILSGSGYGGAELLRLLGAHPNVCVTQIASRSRAGQAVTAVHRHLVGFCDLQFSDAIDLATLCANGPAVLFSALPNGTSSGALDALLGTAWPKGLTVIDLSGDLRLRDSALHAQHYPETPDLPALRARARCGIVELAREQLRGATLIANPGCFATALQLALAPLVQHGLRGVVAATGVTGSSGSGAQPSAGTHHPARHADFRAYKLGGHQHAAEVTQQFGADTLQLSFVPHSAPWVRGIHVTIHAPRSNFSGALPTIAALRAFYANEPFVRVRDDAPHLVDVVGTNFCDITCAVQNDALIVCATIDNLGKGMASHAIQHMNLQLGLPETTGLWNASLGVV